MKLVEFHIDGDAARAKATVVQALETRKFRFTWADEWSGVAERGSKIIHLWQHDFWAPPIAMVDDIRELSRDQLPEPILRTSPRPAARVRRRPKGMEPSR